MGIKIGIGGLKIGGNNDESWSSYWAQLISATVETAAPTEVVLTFPSAKTALGASDFTIAGFTVSSASWTGNAITLVISPAVVYGDSIVVMFVKTGGTATVTNNVAIETEYTALLAELTGTAPSASLQVRQNKFFARLKGSNVYARNTFSKLAAALWYCSEMPTGSDSLFWINNPARKATLSATPPTYIIGRGWKGNASSAYIDTTFNAADDGSTLFVRDNATLGKYFTNYRDSGNTSGDGGIISSKGIGLNPKYTGNNISGRLNSDYTDLRACSVDDDVNNLFTLNRTASTGFSIYRFTTKFSDELKASVDLVDISVYDLAINNNGTPTTHSSDIIGMDIYASAFDDTDRSVVSDALNEFMKPDISLWQGAGVALAFDDFSRSPSWVNADAICTPAYDWKATFFINNNPDLTREPENGHLLTLLAAGHEIANHSYNHIDWVTYLETHTIGKFYHTEISLMQERFRDVLGWEPTTYGYAQVYGSNTDLNNQILNHGYITRVRPVVDFINEDYTSALVTKSNFSPVIMAIDIWAFAGDVDAILAAVDYANTHNAILCLVAHTVGASDAKLVIAQTTLNAICQRVVDNGMKFYRMKDIPIS